MRRRTKSERKRKSKGSGPPKAKQAARAKTQPQTLPLRKKFLFSAVTVVILLVFLELTLMLLGVQPAYQSGDPLVGFSKQLPHFIETKGSPSGTRIVTAQGKSALNPQEFSKKKGSDTYRIFCLGGSTTYGRPFWDQTSFSGWLRAFLPSADPGKNWEVVNAGGISYASYRILSVMEELAEHQPDLFIICMGHNEFLERRTYGDLLDRPELLRDLSANAHRLRTAAVVKGVADRIAGRGSGGEKLIVLESDVKRIPIDAIGPEGYTRDDALKEQVITHFRLSLNRMLDVAEACGAKVLLVSPSSNYRHAAPFKSEHSAGLTPEALRHWEAAHASAGEHIGNGNSKSVLADLEACIANDPDHAQTHFRYGGALYDSGKFSEARAAFAQAIEQDICPLRAIRPIIETIHDTAAARAIPLIDFQTLLDHRAENGITGENFFHDHVHPTIEGNRILALEIVEHMHQIGWLTPSADWHPATVEAISDRVTAAIDKPRYAEELLKLAYVLDTFDQERGAFKAAQDAIALDPDNESIIGFAVSLYSKRNRLEPITDLLEERNRRHPEDRRALISLGETYLKMARFDKAVSAYRRLLSLDPQDASIHERLGVALSQNGNHDAAAKHLSTAADLNPQSAPIQNNLGLVLASAEKYALAITHYEKALALMPALASAHYNYGIALEEMERAVEAAAHYREVLILQPDHPGAAQRLAHLRSGL